MPYLAELGFRLRLNELNSRQRALAGVFDEWSQVAPSLSQLGVLRGLHDLRRGKPIELHDSTVPLLMAQREDGVEQPFAVASFPGKGRALWVFSDSLWQVAMAPQVSRKVYRRLMHGAFLWLLREDLRPALRLQSSTLLSLGKQAVGFELALAGPALNYFTLGKDWSLAVCGQTLSPEMVISERLGDESLKLQGQLQLDVQSERCQVEVKGQNDAFGSVHVSQASFVVRPLTDQEVQADGSKLRSLSEISGARLQFIGGSRSQKDDGFAAFGDSLEGLYGWLKSLSVGEQVPLPKRVVWNWYGFLEASLFWWLLLALPLEVVFRRFHAEPT